MNSDLGSIDCNYAFEVSMGRTSTLRYVNKPIYLHASCRFGLNQKIVYSNGHYVLTWHVFKQLRQLDIDAGLGSGKQLMPADKADDWNGECMSGWKGLELT